MGTLYTNADGLVQNYGTNDSRNHLVRRTGELGGVQTLTINFTYDNLPDYDVDASGGSTPDSFGEAQAYIPAGSVITRGYMLVTTAFAGGTSYTIGTYEKDGTVIDADGIEDATKLALANIDAAGDIISCGGALLVNGDSNLTPNPLVGKDAYIKMTASGTFTAGAATLVVEYIAPRA